MTARWNSTATTTRGDAGPVGRVLSRRGMPRRRRDRCDRCAIRRIAEQRMREERVIALAGMFQAIALVRAIALRGGCDATAMQPSVASVFKIDADEPDRCVRWPRQPALGPGNTDRPARRQATRPCDDPDRDLGAAPATQTLPRGRDMLGTLRERHRSDCAADRSDRGNQFGRRRASRPALRRYAVDTAPRIVVEGNPQFLRQDAQVAQIRALLLAAIRAAVLWRQLGGSHWRLLFRRRQYAMLARGLLAQCTLSGG